MMRFKILTLLSTVLMCFAGLASAQPQGGQVIESDITPPARDWRQGPPPQGMPAQQTEDDDFSGDFFEPVPEEQRDLNETTPPEPPNPNEDIYQGRGSRGVPPPPPGYENLTLPGEPPRN